MKPIRRIVSRDNEQIKFARKVRDGRERTKIFLEGVRLVGEVPRSRASVDRVFVTPAFLEELPEPELEAWLHPRQILEVSEPVLESISDTNQPQGIIAIADRPGTGADEIGQVATRAVPLVVFLHQINNPSNLGAVVRAAEAAGVAGVIVSDGSADVFSPKAMRASMGSSLRMPIWTGADLEAALEWARGMKLRSTAADVNGSRSYADLDWQVPRMLVLGSEAHGLDESDLERIDDLIVIPMEKEVESLNLAVACGVIVFEARRQAAAR